MRRASLFIGFGLLLANEVFTASNICHETGEPPEVPFGLELCYMYSHNACCLPGYDLEVKSAYSNIVPGGSRCEAGSQIVYTSLYSFLEYLCLPCNPKEPSYRFETAVGDVVDGGIIPPVPGAAPGEYTWRICKSFLYGAPGKEEGIWGKDGSQYDQCGIKLQSCSMTPVLDVSTLTINAPSPTCDPENEVLIPSIAFKGSTDPALEMLTRIAQTFSDFQIAVVDDYDAAFDFERTPCFGKSIATVHCAHFSLLGLLLSIVLSAVL